MNLYSIDATMTVRVSTLVRAATRDEALQLAIRRNVESSWQHIDQSDSALTHWLISDVQAPRDPESMRVTSL